MTRPTTLERFWLKVDKTGDCWLWTAAVDHYGYGRFRIGNRHVIASRWSLSHELGRSLTPTEWALHSCDNPPCVNPEHLYIGDADRNAQDRVERNRDGMATKTHCPRNHAYTAENTYLYQNKRHCRACNRRRVAEFQRRKSVA